MKSNEESIRDCGTASGVPTYRSFRRRKQKTRKNICKTNDKLSNFFEKYQFTYLGITTNSKSNKHKESHVWTHHGQTFERQEQR